MKKVMAMLLAVGLLGAGCQSAAPAPARTANQQVIVSGQIQTITTDGFVLRKRSNSDGALTSEQVTIRYNATTRFAVPDGSGIGAPITKPQIESGLEVEVQGTITADNNVQAENIIINAG